MYSPLTSILLYFVMPIWLLAGFADWLCHRKSHIESTTGLKESVIHLLMFGEIGVALLAGLFLEINAGVIALMIGVFLVHEVTALWDVSYAVTGREVTPIEQHIHSFLELIPLLAVVCVAALHWSQFEALFGIGAATPRFSVALKAEPLPALYVICLFAAITVLVVLPYLEELYRCWQAPSRPSRGSN